MSIAAGARLAGMLSRFSKGIQAGSNAVKLGVNSVDEIAQLGKAGKMGYGLGKAYESEAGSFLMGSLPNVGFPIVFGENPIRAGVNGLISQGLTTAVGMGTQKLIGKYAGENAGNIARYVVEMPTDLLGGVAVDMATSAIVPRQMPQQAQEVEPQRQQIQQIGPPGIPAYDQQRIQAEVMRRQQAQMMRDQQQLGAYY